MAYFIQIPTPLGMGIIIFEETEGYNHQKNMSISCFLQQLHPRRVKLLDIVKVLPVFCRCIGSLTAYRHLQCCFIEIKIIVTDCRWYWV